MGYMFKNKIFSSLMFLVVLMTSFSNYNVPLCMDTLITNPFIKLSLIFFISYSMLNNHKTSLLVSLLIYFITESNKEKIINKPIDEEKSAEIVLENGIKELEKEVKKKDEISKVLENVIDKDSNNLVDQEIKEVINIKSSRGMTDNCKECSFLKSIDYKIKVEELSGYESNNYYNIN